MNSVATEVSVQDGTNPRSRLDPLPPSASLRPTPRWVPALWALPLVLALLFSLVIALWAQHNDVIDRAEQADSIKADTLSLEAQLRGRLETEEAQLRAVAARLASGMTDADTALAVTPEVAAGLGRLWLSLVWLDANNQLVGQAKRQQGPDSGSFGAAATGQTLHLVAPVIEGANGRGGRLIARYDPADLLKSGGFWWLALKYDVDLVSGLGQVIASTAGRGSRSSGLSYEKLFEGIPDATLRLTRREPHRPWFTNARTLILILGLIFMSAAAAALLRRQMMRTARAETDWRTEAAWRRAMEESALVGLRARDLEGRILYVNRTLCEMVGYTQGELEGLVPPLPFWPPDTVDELMANNQKTLQGQAPRDGAETRWRHRDGRPLVVMIFEAPLVDAAGRHVGWMGSIADITDRKQLEEVERRQTEAMARYDRLTTIGEVASTLAHELNQPLTAIAAYSAGVSHALRKDPATNPELLAALDATIQQSAQAGRIVHRIRSRLSLREQAAEMFDLNGMVSDALDLLKRPLAEAGVQVKRVLQASLPETRGDRVGLEQVVTNLVRNAVDALGGVPQERLITVTTSIVGLTGGSGSAIRLDVADNGPGLGGRPVQTLCASFYSTKQEGMGMGLAICRSIVEAHGGQLEAREADGGGAHFSVILPLTDLRPEGASA